VTDERVTIERTVFIAASPETVFGFFVDPTLMAQWIGVVHTLEARPGGVLRIDFKNGHVALGAFTTVEPYRRLAFTWGWFIVAYHLLDIVPRGRDESGLAYGMEWLRHHDRYQDQKFIDPYVHFMSKE